MSEQLHPQGFETLIYGVEDRQMMWRMLGAVHPMTAHQIDSAAVPQLGASADAREGVESFFEKRPANFTLGPSGNMPAVYPWFTEPDFEPLD